MRLSSISSRFDGGHGHGVRENQPADVRYLIGLSYLFFDRLKFRSVCEQECPAILPTLLVE